MNIFILNKNGCFVTYTCYNWGKEDVQNFSPSCTKQFEQIVLITYNLLLTNGTYSRTRNESIVFAYENAGVLIYVVSLYKCRHDSFI